VLYVGFFKLVKAKVISLVK